MKGTMTKFLALMIFSIFMSSSLALAAEKDKEKNPNTPPGWEQGEKTGWEGDAPPGLTEEKLQKKKKAWKKSGKQKVQVKNEGEKTKHESELKKEKAKYESEIKEEKKKRKAEIED